MRQQIETVLGEGAVGFEISVRQEDIVADRVRIHARRLVRTASGGFCAWWLRFPYGLDGPTRS